MNDNADPLKALTIRHAKKEDAPSIAQAQREIAKEPGFFCSQPFELTDQKVEQMILKSLNSTSSVYFVAESNGEIVGHAFLEQLGLQSLSHVVELNIVVNRNRQERGIGTQLMEKLIEWARNSPIIEKIELSVRASNIKAISLYKKMGFQEEGRLKKHVKTKCRYYDDILMALDFKEEKEITFRPMKQEDIHSLATTFCFPWTSLQTTTEKWQRYYEEQQKHIRIVYLVELAKKIIGYGSLLQFSEYFAFKQENIPEINDVWIAENMRNKGFGKSLILQLEHVARKKEHKQIGIGVGLYKDYGSAQKLYIKMGYIPDGKGITYKHNHVIPGEMYPVDDELILWLVKPL